MIGRPTYLEYTVKDREWVDRWEYRRFKEYPPGDAKEETIMAFIKDAKRSEKVIQRDLIYDGNDADVAYRASCQWPLKDDAPMEAIRSFIGYMHDLADPQNDGIDM